MFIRLGRVILDRKNLTVKPADDAVTFIDLVRKRGYYFDKRNAQYISKWNKQPVKEKTVRGNIERFLDKDIRNNMQGITDEMIDGRRELPSWQRQMAREIKDAWAISATVGRGGRDQMTFADWGRVGGRLRFEYQQLNRFALQIQDGQLTAEQIRFRVGLYVNAARTAYFDGLTSAKEASEKTEERRLLNPAEHCDDCILYAAQGWQPIGTLPQPGEQSACQRNCKCTKVYR